MAYKLKKISAKGRIDNIKSSINALFLGNVKTETDAELYAKVITGILDYYVGIVKGRKTMDNLLALVDGGAPGNKAEKSEEEEECVEPSITHIEEDAEDVEPQEAVEVNPTVQVKRRGRLPKKHLTV